MLAIHAQTTTVTADLPPELFYKIITWVIAQSVHSICLLPEEVQWELKFMETLCLVSSVFRDITLDVACKAFEIKPAEGALSIPALVYVKLRSLHALRLQLDSPSKTLLIPTQDAALVSGYMVYLTTVSLRCKSVSAGADVLKMTHQSMLGLLGKVLPHCEKIEPSEMADLLRSALHDENDIVRVELDTVHAATALNTHIEYWKNIHNTEEETERDRIRMIKRIEIHEAFEVIERADEQCKNARHTMRIVESAHLPEVLPAIRNLQAIEFDVDEYDMKARLGSLIKRWRVTCPFLEQTRN